MRRYIRVDGFDPWEIIFALLIFGGGFVIGCAVGISLR